MIKLSILNANNFSDMMFGRGVLFYSPDTDDIKELMLNLNFGNDGMKATLTHKDGSITDYTITAISAMPDCDLFVAVRRYNETVEDVEKQIGNIKKVISTTEAKQFTLTKKLLERTINAVKNGDDTNTPSDTEKRELKELSDKIAEGEVRLQEAEKKLRIINSNENRLIILLSWTFWKKLRLRLQVFLTNILPTKN